jgi:hypothetical protein
MPLYTANWHIKRDRMIEPGETIELDEPTAAGYGAAVTIIEQPEPEPAPAEPQPKPAAKRGK